MRAAEGGSWREWRPGPGPSGRRLGLGEGLRARVGRAGVGRPRGPSAATSGVRLWPRPPPGTRASPLISAPTLFLLPGPGFLPLLASPPLSPRPEPFLLTRRAGLWPRALPPARLSYRQPRKAGEGWASDAREAAHFPAALSENPASGNHEAGSLPSARRNAARAPMHALSDTALSAVLICPRADLQRVGKDTRCDMRGAAGDRFGLCYSVGG